MTPQVQRATAALVTYGPAYDAYPEDVLLDALCDIMHWAKWHGVSFDESLHAARNSFVEESEVE